MKKGLFEKFSQNPVLLDRLLKTGQKKIVQHTANTSYWGDGGDGTGLNRLGVLLM